MKQKDLFKSKETKISGKKKKDKTCSAIHFVDESYRMDDNSDFSSTAIAENECQSEPLSPGVGVEES